MRYVYVKNGNAVDQLRRIAQEKNLDRSGPDAFIGDFLQAHREDDVLILCRASRRDRQIVGRHMAESLAVQEVGLRRLLSRAWLALRIGGKILAWRPRAILCGCGGELLWVCTLASKLLGVPIVHSRHNEVRRVSGVGRIFTKLDSLCIRACTGVVCHGPFLRDQILAQGISPRNVREFEVDLSEFAVTGRDAVAPEKLQTFVRRFARVLMFVGRVQVNKGVLDLLQAFHALRSSCGVATGLVYAGDGRDLALLALKVRELGLTDCVLVTGRIPHDQLPGVMCCASAIVTPTRPEFPEGRCMVVLEALALGIPVIAPNSGPFPYAITHGINGLIFEAGDVLSLGTALLHLMQDDQSLATLKRGAEECRRQFVGRQSSFSQAVDLTLLHNNI